ncbi:MAG TPA: tripartite tricarboxylate transporter TctB family protein [Geminicoccaceae bacterium]|nr:tripartite tricarboxylate transporter TctB family protein [Geminicoccus sp.]HMU51443.1 tripartite tricarboxylate transporter TctB family protein [Geminicoccaceae bacterium]
MRFNDALIGAALLLLAASILFMTRNYPSMPGQHYGPALFPNIIGLGLGACGLVLVVSGLRRLREHPWLDFDEWTRTPGHLTDVALVLLGLVAYILLSDLLGFLVIGTALLTLWMVRFRGGKVLSSLVVAVIAALVIDYAFRRILLVPLPLGPLAGVIW